MKRLRVGVVGLGAIAQVMHLPHLHAYDERFELAALCDRDSATLDAVGDLYGVPAACRFTDYQTLLAQDLAAVLVLTGGSHAPFVLDALAAGKHVFVEKPLCYTLREADEIGAAQRATGLTVVVGYMKRYDPGYRHALQIVQGLDRLRAVQVTVLHPAEEPYFRHQPPRRGGQPAIGAPPTREETLAAARREVGAGRAAALIAEAIGEAPIEQRIVYSELIGSLIHDVNALRGILGEPVAIEPTISWNEGLCFLVTLRFPRDVVATLQWLYLPTYERYQEELAFFADDARVRLQFPSPYLRNAATSVVVEGMSDGVAWERRDTVSYEEAFALELLHFYDCAVGAATPLTPIADGRADLALLREVALTWTGRGNDFPG